MASYKLNCPLCGAVMKVPESLRGQRGRCPKCGEQFVAPAEQIRPPADASTDLIEPEEFSIALADTPSLPRRKKPLPWRGILAVIALLGCLVLVVIAILWDSDKNDVSDVADRPADIQPAESEEGPAEPFAEAPRTVADLTPEMLSALAEQAGEMTPNSVDKLLKAPKTAEYFDVMAGALAAKPDAEALQFRVSGQVDAMNEFAVPLRHSFGAVWTLDIPGQAWRLTALYVDRRMVYGDKADPEGLKAARRELQNSFP